MAKKRQYIAIDLKSFYASVECVERKLDPLDTFLVVADESRTEKTICLAVSPALKAFGVPGRARLFEVYEKVKQVNEERRRKAPGGWLEEEGSHFNFFLKHNPNAKVDFIIAKPQMAHYMKVSADVVSVYLKYIAPEDIHVYSVDEVFIDATNYLWTYGMTARELAVCMVRDVLRRTGITATAGIGTNMYLAKIAMDIDAKHIKADKDGVRIAELDEMSYRQRLWAHRPITDFWRVGAGTARRLEKHGMFTMGDIARCSVWNEDLLYRVFGKNAELLIDHAWGYEPCTIEAVKHYTPMENSLSAGQVLACPYAFVKARLVLKEMLDNLSLKLVRYNLLTDQIVLAVGYDVDNLKGKAGENYRGEITVDYYGRRVPKSAHGSVNLGGATSSTRRITEKALQLFDNITDPDLLIRRLTVGANHILSEAGARSRPMEQLDLFSSCEEQAERWEREENALRKERRIQETMIGIKHRFGKNGILKGMNLEEGATARERNAQIGGHRA